MLSQTQTQDDEYRLFTDSTISYMGDSLVEEKLKKKFDGGTNHFRGLYLWWQLHIDLDY